MTKFSLVDRFPDSAPPRARGGFAATLRWLDTVFQGQYLPSLSINYVSIKKVLEKLPSQLYQIKMKICYDQGGNGIGVVIATK